MSDVDSVESESMDVVRSGDGSDFYQHYDEESMSLPTPPPSSRFNPKTSQKGKANSPLFTPATGVSKGSFRNQSMSAITTSKSQDEQSYSEAFEEYDEYDENDFETISTELELGNTKSKKASPIIKPDKNKLQPTASSVQLSAAEPNTYHALQAELALEEISKEVLRLRAAQKHELQLRRQRALEKKQRAENRRQVHQEELNALKHQVSLLNDEKVCLENDIQDKLLKISSLEATLISLKAGKEEAERQIQQLKVTLEDCLSSKVLLLTEIEAERRELKASHAAINEERVKLKSEAFKYQALHEIIEKSMEANERRLRKDREDIPVYHKRLIDEQFERLKTREISLSHREAALKLEEERRYLQSESLKKLAVEEAATYRRHIEEDILRERQALDQAKADFIKEKNEFHTSIDLKQQSIENQLLSIQQHQQSLQEERLSIDALRLEVQQQKLLIEPYLQSAQLQREEAAALKRQAQELIQANEARLSNIIRKEQELIDQESLYRETQKKKLADEIKFQDERKLLISKTAQLQSLQNELKAERFRLHNQAMEISDTAFFLQQYLRQVRLQSSTSTISSRPLSRGTDSNDKPWSLGMDIDTFLEQAKALGREGSRLRLTNMDEDRKGSDLAIVPSPNELIRDLDNIHHRTSSLASEVFENRDNPINLDAANSTSLTLQLSDDSISVRNEKGRPSSLTDPLHSNQTFYAPPTPSSISTSLAYSMTSPFKFTADPVKPSYLPSNVNADLIRSSIEVSDAKTEQLRSLAAKYAT